jgi:pyruvate formate lyase activating enzyme
MATPSIININSVQRFCLQDGPGIRTTVFLQGCAMHCWWCHNAAMQPMARADTSRSIEGVVKEVRRDARYWAHSGGGVTLSGGEPLCQAEGAASLLTALGKRGYHRCIETAGCACCKAVEALDEVVDVWLFDLKTLDPKAFARETGGDLALVLANLQDLLNRRANSVWVRIPLIHGFNDDRQSLEEMRRFLEEHPRPARIQLLPGHSLGGPYRKNPAVGATTCRKAEGLFRETSPHVEACW